MMNMENHSHTGIQGKVLLTQKSFLMTALVSACFMAAAPANALEKLSDNILSNTTAQDGITIKYQGEGTIGLDKVRLIQNGNDFSLKDNTAYNGFNNSAGIEVDISNEKIRFCSDDTASSSCSLDSTPTEIVIDSDGGGTGNAAFVNASVKMASKSIFVPATTINLIGTADTELDKNTTWKKVPILQFTKGIQINGKSGLSANIQLGNQPQDSMILLAAPTDVYGTDVLLGDIKVFSQAENSANDSQISTNVSVIGFSGKLTDSAQTTASSTRIDIDGTDGLVITKETATIKQIQINNTVFGSNGVADTSAKPVFDGLKNASIGNISIDNIKINDLKVSVQGM